MTDLLTALFEDVRETEEKAVAGARTEIASIDGQVLLVQRAQALAHAPGWNEFRQSLEASLQRVTKDLVTTTRSSEYMRQQQGRAQALGDVLTILTRGAQLLEQLLKRKDALSESLDNLLRSMPRQRKET